MAERLSRWGVGPRIMGPTLIFGALAGAVSRLFPDTCVVESLGTPAAVAIAVLLVGIGLVVWLAGAVSVMRAYNRDELVTTGMLALVRNPIYSGWIVFILPGLAILSRAWPLFLAPLVAYVLFKRLIRREDEYLAKRFGQAYLDYRRRVNEILPIPRTGRGR